VISASQYTSEVEIDRALDTAKILSSWVYLDEVNYGELGVKVGVRIENQALKNSLLAMLKDVKQATIVETGADLFIEEGMENLSKDSLYITDAGERTIWKINKSIQPNLLRDSLVINVGDYARARYLKKLDLKNKNYKVTVEFVPVICVSGCGTDEPVYKDGPVRKMNSDSIYITFKEGDKFRLNIVNQSDQKTVYYTVLDIQPDNKVNVLIPSPEDRAEDFYIPQQEKIELDRIYTVGPPVGTDMLKVIASDVPIDLRSMVVTRGAGTRGSKNPFEKIMQSTYNAENTKTRSVGSEPIKPDAVNIETISFTIVQAKK
jgi:uncharacterized protein YxjI